tara:strand:- start:2245 stop:2874 length:630 start_codon:yes stop_codon:yes gene_type:complete
MNKRIKRWLVLIWVLIFLSFLFFFFYVATGVKVKKPAVYLYPEEDSFIDVSVQVNGKITKSIPDYINGWNVFVTEKGIINGKYDYLFYEADLRKVKLPDGGWIVKYEELDNWLEDNLIRFGLNKKEKEQFIEYWANELPESRYYLIKLLDEEFLEKNMKLVINPIPDSVIRLDFYFKPIDERIDIREPEIKTPKREGFVVVEWGGILDN